MIDYFSPLKHDSGLKFLEKAANKGHVVASYVYGIILVCYGGEHRNKGVKVLSDLKRSKSCLVITECRKKVQRIVWMMWVKNYLVEIGPAEEEFLKKRKKTCSCCNTGALCSFIDNQTRSNSKWTCDEDYYQEYFCLSNNFPFIFLPIL